MLFGAVAVNVAVDWPLRRVVVLSTRRTAEFDELRLTVVLDVAARSNVMETLVDWPALMLDWAGVTTTGTTELSGREAEDVRVTMAASNVSTCFTYLS